MYFYKRVTRRRCTANLRLSLNITNQQRTRSSQMGPVSAFLQTGRKLFARSHNQDLHKLTSTSLERQYISLDIINSAFQLRYL